MRKTDLGDIWVQEADGDVIKHIMSIIDIKKMIPVKFGVYSVVNLNKEISDTPEMIKYKDLLNKEYSFCLKIIGDLVKKANKLYNHQMNTGKI